jgi:hypothetical protein
MKRKFHNASYCMLDASLIESDAFRDLSGKAAMLVLIRFHQKAHRKRTGKRSKRVDAMTITNNGQILFPYAEARELGIRSDATTHKVFCELVEEKGFIDVATPGNWYTRQPTKFALSQRWKRYGTPDYKRVEIPRRLPRGLGFQCGHSG